jgi:hypothetical protein
MAASYFAPPTPTPPATVIGPHFNLIFVSLFVEASSSYAFEITILWRIDLLLSGDSANNDRFWATAR